MRQRRSFSFAAWLEKLHFSMDHRVKPGGDDIKSIALLLSNGEPNHAIVAQKTSRPAGIPKAALVRAGRAEVDAAHVATCRLYCDALDLWRRCVKLRCRRHRCCLGEPTGCFVRGLPAVSAKRRLKAQKQVIAGGPRRIAPATHIEWTVRRSALKQIVSWGLG
jgi:hypothetical protein